MEMPETTRPKQRRATPFAAVWKMEPRIQIAAPIWIAVLRESLSAMKDEDSAPTRDPAGIDAVIPPWR